jgi:pentatricopeptide repeat protein
MVLRVTILFAIVAPMGAIVMNSMLNMKYGNNGGGRGTFGSYGNPNELWHGANPENPFERSKRINHFIRKCGTDWEAALKCLNKVREEREGANAYIYTAAIDVCARARRWQEAVDLLVSMEMEGFLPNSHTFAGAINACVRGGKWDKGLALFDMMQKRGLQPHMGAYEAALGACGRGGHFSRAQTILAAIEAEACTPSNKCYEEAIKACGNGGEWQAALSVLAMAEASAPSSFNGAGPASVQSYVAALQALEKAGRSSESLTLLDGMAVKGVEPNYLAYNTAILTCAASGLTAEALALLERTRSAGNKPSSAAFNGCVVAYSSKGQFEEAVALMERASEFGLSPDAFASSNELNRIQVDGAGAGFFDNSYDDLDSADYALDIDEPPKKRARKWNR